MQQPWKKRYGDGYRGVPELLSGLRDEQKGDDHETHHRKDFHNRRS